MEVAEAQREVRSVYLGSFVGHLVIGLLWLASAAVSTWLSLKVGAISLVIAGFFIYPLTQLILHLSGRPASLSRENPLRELSIEVAFMIGPLFLLVGAATLHKAAWFYPSMMIVIGAHYLPFSFVYGMRQFIGLSVILMFTGILVGMYAPSLSTAAAWFAGVVFLGFAFVGLAVSRKECVPLSSPTGA
ncbi:MAG TPA: hypothetical protein VGU63_04915 [Candidatus Acidoferrales bacterium]|nr:hypothetical protein [Candidatus Acidoferrales bacterium]